VSQPYRPDYSPPKKFSVTFEGDTVEEVREFIKMTMNFVDAPKPNARARRRVRRTHSRWVGPGPVEQAAARRALNLAEASGAQFK
jgi:hypothetical protein